MLEGFVRHRIGEGHVLWEGRVAEGLEVGDAQMEELWAMHPEERHVIQMHGRPVRTPRWQQAFGADYSFSGTVSRAVPTPPFLEPYLGWARECFHPRINGLLLNWYDATLGHYIGKHRDSTRNMVKGAPIVTLSVGAARIFRLRPWGQSKGGFIDFDATHNTVFVIPYETNLAWTHEVPHRKRDRGRRISLTLRAFLSEGLEA